MRNADGLRAYLRAGGLIAYGTESCFGLGCDPRNYAAVKRLARLKRRPQHKGLILIADRFARLAPYVAPIEEALLRKAWSRWPGPHTWLVPPSRRTSRAVRGRHNRVAVRVDAHPDAVALCRALRMALVSTSANRSGARPVTDYRDCLRQFGRSVLVLRGRIGRRKAPSTIQDLIDDSIIRG